MIWQIHTQPKLILHLKTFKNHNQPNAVQYNKQYHSACFKFYSCMKWDEESLQKELKRAIVQLHWQKETSYMSPSRWLNYSTYMNSSVSHSHCTLLKSLQQKNRSFIKYVIHGRVREWSQDAGTSFFVLDYK